MHARHVRWLLAVLVLAPLALAGAQTPTPPQAPPATGGTPSAAGAAPAEAPPPTRRTFALVFRTGPAWDKTKAPGEQAHFADHSANIRKLGEEGRLLVGGRFSDMGLLLVEARDEAEAQALVARDASVSAGVFQAEIHPWSTFAEGCVTRAPRPGPVPSR